MKNAPSVAATEQYTDDIDLAALFKVVWSAKWLVIGVTTAFAVLAVAIALYLPNIYKAEAIVAPASSQTGGDLAKLAGQFGGLASLAGISLGSSTTDQSGLAIEIMKSRDFVGRFVQKHNILVPLMAAERWDLNSNKLVIDQDMFSEAEQRWVRNVPPPLKPEPSVQEAHLEFQETVEVTQNKETGLISIAVNHVSPSIAKQWVDWLIDDINQEMRTRDLSAAQASKGYLEQQLQHASAVELQEVLYHLIEEQEKTIMLASVQHEYVFKVIDPALVPELKAKPSRALICIVGTFLGGCLAVFFVLLRHAVRSRNSGE